jgi:hypothetical protein
MLCFPVFVATHARPFTTICTLYRFSCPITRISRLYNSFRMNTCKSVSKQKTLTAFRMNTYEKYRGWGAVMVNQLPSEFNVQTLRRSGVATFPRSDVLFIASLLFALYDKSVKIRDEPHDSSQIAENDLPKNLGRPRRSRRAGKTCAPLY